MLFLTFGEETSRTNMKAPVFLLIIVAATCFSSCSKDPLDRASGTFTDSRDSHVYKTIKIGDQTWMAENLAYLPFVTPITTSSRTEPCIYVYGYQGDEWAEAKNVESFNTYGALYNIQAALTLCPPGWHLPSMDEWREMADYLVANGYNYDGTDSLYKIAKALASTSYWEISDVEGSPGFEPEKNNSSGLSLEPGGYMASAGAFKKMGTVGYWWTSTCSDDWYYGIQRVTNTSTTIGFGTEGYTGGGWSVRCVKDR